MPMHAGHYPGGPEKSTRHACWLAVAPCPRRVGAQLAGWPAGMSLAAYLRRRGCFPPCSGWAYSLPPVQTVDQIPCTVHDVNRLAALACLHSVELSVLHVEWEV